MGWSNFSSFQSRLFGNLPDSVFWSSHCPVAVVKLLEDPIDIQKILVPVKNLSPQTIRTIRFAQIFAEANNAQITLMHIRDRKTKIDKIKRFETRLENLIKTKIDSPIAIKTKVICDDDTAHTIVREAEDHDLVVLRSMRRRTAGGLAVSDISDRVVKGVHCSTVLFGEPQDKHNS